MVRSIYNHVDHIVFVNSEKSWDHGLKGNVDTYGNTCKPVIEKLKKQDIWEKIISIDCNTGDQFHQCMEGYRYIQNNLNADWVMLIDTDEVWDDYNLTHAISYLKRNENHDYVYRARLYTYIKSPFYRVEPEEVMAPTIFVSARRKDLGKNHRCCQEAFMQKMTTDIIPRKPIWFHHFVYVRRDFNTVLEKIRNSNGYEGNKIVDLEDWTENVWNKIPEPLEGQWRKGFHPAVHFKKHWAGIKEITLDDLPEVFHEHPHLLGELSGNL